MQGVASFNDSDVLSETVENYLEWGIYRHGPRGALYPYVACGIEGDTPLGPNLIPNGLNCPERWNRGGWGGRYELHKPGVDSLKRDIGGVSVEPEGPSHLDRCGR